MKYEHITVDSWPNLMDMNENVICGAFSWLGVSSHTRWVKASTAINVGGYLSTPGDVARDYLSLKYAKRRRITAEQKAAITQRRSQPLYCDPIHLMDGSYVDIKSAFWSIMSIVGWDVDYFPNRWLSAGERMTDFPYYGHKMTRNCLVTMGLLGVSKMWLHQRKTIGIKRIGNRFVNYQLWALVQDVLNGVASDVRDKVFYVHTDGYILYSEDSWEVQKRIGAWGLPSRVKMRGEVNIHGPAQYGFNSQAAKRFPGPSTGMVGIRDVPDKTTLRLSLYKLARFADPVPES